MSIAKCFVNFSQFLGKELWEILSAQNWEKNKQTTISVKWKFNLIANTGTNPINSELTPFLHLKVCFLELWLCNLI